MADYTILALDLGSDMGWAFIKNGIICQSGVVRMVKKDLHAGHRFMKFQNWLGNFVGVNEIFYEDVMRFESGYSAKSYCGYLAILQLFCLVHRIRLVGIKPTSVKMEFAGKGNANKADMCNVAHRLGWKGGHLHTDLAHDECDAIACGWVLLKRRGIEPAFKT